MGEPLTLVIDRLREAIETSEADPSDIVESYRAALLDAARAAAPLDENPCCYSIHEFDQTCPRTGTKFEEAEPFRLLGSGKHRRVG